ncbi:MAG: hypothetical protein ACE5D7_06800 [Fidelibacterota bacterium]
MKSKLLHPILKIIVIFLFFLLIPETVTAIPAFARKYKTSCSTCHYAFPKLNSFGKAFKHNGYRYPDYQDPDMTKEEPVSLGAESYKRVFPDAIWPADIAGTSPITIRALGRIHYGGSWDDPATGTVEDDHALYFEIPHEFELLYGGTVGENVSYFGEVELEHEAELAYEFSVQYDFNPGFHLKLGSVGLSASPENHRLTREHYNVDDLKNQSGTWRMRGGAGGGIELWGAGNGAGGTGGFTYAVGIGNGQNNEENYDMNAAKDFYGRATYKLGGLGEIGGTAGQASESSAFYEDNSVRLGGFFYSGDAVKDDTLSDKFSIMGGDVDWWFNRLNVTALAMTMKSDFNGNERNSLAYFAEANYVFYPWLIARARYESTNKDVDDDGNDPTTTLIPGVIVMIRANTKISFEYKLPLDDASKNAKDERMTIQFDFAL